MTDFKGRKYQLAGFNIHQKNGLVEVFAKFCGVTDTPDENINLSVNSITSVEFQKERDAAEAVRKANRLSGPANSLADTLADLPKMALSTGPFVSVEDVVLLLGAKPEPIDTSGMRMLRLPGPQKEELLEDLGAEKLGLLIVEMGKARENYLAGTEAFVPLAKFNKI